MTKSGQLWGGRFSEKPHETFAQFNDSLRFDRRLFGADVHCSIAHANGLYHAGVITLEESRAIVEGLNALLVAASSGDLWDGADAEDIHSFIEQKLIEKIGDVGRKLHTGRSRNDQVATALRF